MSRLGQREEETVRGVKGEKEQKTRTNTRGRAPVLVNVKAGDHRLLVGQQVALPRGVLLEEPLGDDGEEGGHGVLQAADLRDER